MIKDTLFEKKNLPENLGASAAQIKLHTNVSSATGVLTEKSVNRAIAYLQDPKRLEEARAVSLARHGSQTLLWLALDQKLITEYEYWWLLSHIDGHGHLIVSPKYYDILKKVREPKEEPKGPFSHDTVR